MGRRRPSYEEGVSSPITIPYKILQFDFCEGIAGNDLIAVEADIAILFPFAATDQEGKVVLIGPLAGEELGALSCEGNEFAIVILLR